MIALLLALTAAQDVPVRKEVSFKDLAIGDRVEVRFHSGNSISGVIVAPPAKPRGDAPDLANQSSLTLDVSMEYPGLNGTMTVLRKEMQKVTKLHELDRVTRERLDAMRKLLAQGNEAPPPRKAGTPGTLPPTSKADPKPEEPKSPDDAKAEEEMRKGKDLLAKFPAPDWGADRMNAIRVKRLRGVIPSLDEQEFEKVLPLWEKARAAAQATPANSQKN